MTDLIKKDPFANIFPFSRWVDDFTSLSASSQRGLKVHETDKDIVVEAVVAGIPANDVDINIEDGVLTIKAERSEETKKKGLYKSSSYQYYYTCALSGGAWDKADADFEDGVVTITIPKTEAARPRKIAVKVKGK